MPLSALDNSRHSIVTMKLSGQNWLDPGQIPLDRIKLVYLGWRIPRGLR